MLSPAEPPFALQNGAFSLEQSFAKLGVARVFARALFDVLLLLPTVDPLAARVATFFLGTPRCIPPRHLILRFIRPPS